MDYELDAEYHGTRMSILQDLFTQQERTMREESIERRLLIALEGFHLMEKYYTLRVYVDGTGSEGEPMWCAMVGPNIQEGCAGFSICRLTAKERLLENIQNPEGLGT